MLAGMLFVKMSYRLEKESNRPLCMNKMKKKPKNKTHIFHILFVLCICLTYSQKQEENSGQKFINHASVVQNKINIPPILSIYLSKDRKTLNYSQKSLYISLLLILLSNDINPNPGPKYESVKCHICKKDILNEYQHLKCESCKKHYHINCQEIKISKNLQANHIEWICKTKNCTPNYQKTYFSTKLYNGNRYFPLSDEQENTQHTNQSHQENTIQLTRSEFENLSLLNELTNISPEDYDGKSLCRICHKEVKMTNRAISCDLCDMWSHLKCSDVSVKLYNHLTFLNTFKWSCVKCRSKEPVIQEKIDISKLSKTCSPENYEIVKEKRNETLIVHLNCRSLIKKKEELEYVVNELNPTIICLSETWFDSSVSKNDYVPEGYSIIRHDRSDDYKQKYGKSNGGGLAVIYKKTIKVQKVHDLTDPIEEILWVRIQSKFSFLLGVLYRAEYTDTLKETLDECLLENNIRKVSEKAKSVVLVGDFNINYSNYEDKMREKLENICTTNGLYQLINKPTRIDPNTFSQTIIDHIWANKEYVPIKDSGTTIGISDHLATYVKLNKKIEEKSKTVTSRNYKNYDPESFNNSLQQSITESDLEKIIESKQVDKAMERLSSIITNTLDKYAPIYERKIQMKFNPIPWLNKELKDIIARKNSLVKDFYQFGLESLKTPIKILNNQIVHLKRKLKKKYLTENLTTAKDDPKKTWKILNATIGSNNNEENTEPDLMTQKKADQFNQYFAHIGENILKELNLTVEPTDLKGHEGFYFTLESEATIAKLIEQIKPDVATGRDGISAKIIKDAKSTITPILTKIINTGYETNTFPNCMKMASVRPIHKKEDTNLISNYRPISILPCLSKVLERSASNQLIAYLEKNNRLNPAQHAYRKQHGTQTCLFQVLDHTQKLLDEGKLVSIVSLDLSKAFDAINHEMLLRKLAHLGLSESALFWIKSYLSNRTQHTKFSNFTSKDEEVTAGVPQGSILGPLLFICFSNDIYNSFQDLCKCFSYADDSQFIVAAKNQKELTKKIELIIRIAHNWYSQNCMKANQGKTEILVINKGNIRTESMKFKVQEKGKLKFLKPKKFIKVLGILIDEHLNWKKQVMKVRKTASNTIRKLHRINHLLPIDIKIQLYNALVVPHFDYADVIWGGCSVEMSRKLQITQNFAVKSITGAKKFDHVTELFEKLKFLSLQQRRNIHEAVFTHKSLLQNHPHDICQMYILQCPTSNTRGSHSAILNYPPHKTQKYENSPFYRCLKSWNSIPENILKNTTTKAFKRDLQKDMIQKQFSKN